MDEKAQPIFPEDRRNWTRRVALALALVGVLAPVAIITPLYMPQMRCEVCGNHADIHVIDLNSPDDVHHFCERHAEEFEAARMALKPRALTTGEQP